MDKLTRLKGEVDRSLQKAADKVTAESTESLQSKVVVQLPQMAVKNGYTGYNKELNLMASIHPFIRLGTLISQIEGWQATRASILTHLGVMLNGVSKLGERNFFSRQKRFGTHTQDGDEIFCDLGGEAVMQIITRLTVSLQSAKGEGSQTRNAMIGTTPTTNQFEGEEQGQTDQTLAISNALAEFMTFIHTKDFTTNECYTQDSFEAKFNLKWEGTS
ncbi:coat protein [Soil-borne cereal mosaic virus]|nr:coat protein [Soil-borne cereal mosaic virus]CAB57864.1 coat protein [Soil-borne cereal mosaic virus]